MLDPDEAERVGDEGAEAGRELEAALLAIVASELSRADLAAPYASALSLKLRIDRAVASAAPKLSEAVKRDIVGAVVLGAARDAKDAADGATIVEGVVSDAVSVARTLAVDASAAASEAARMMGDNARAEYVKAVSRIGLRVRGGEAHRDAMADEIGRLAERGISYTSYVRRDGATVNVPIDVGLRRNARSVALDELGKQTLRIAEASGAEYVEVSSHPGARESHAAWQGRVYMLHGSSPGHPNYYEACRVGDPVNGIGGYNCNHMVRIYRLGEKRRWGGDPLEGTGYDDEQVRELRGEQRRIENDIRKLKRKGAALRAAGIDDSEARKAVRAKQARLRGLVSEHGEVLHRDRWRESIYERAVKEAWGVVPGDPVL